MTLEPPRLPRICYVLSHFHPNASGAERQALAQGIELVRRGHSVRVVTRAVPGQPRDASIGGVLVHRWVRTIAVGPAFGVSFVAGVIRALRRLRPEYDLIHTHQGLWEAISTGTGQAFGLLRGAPSLIQPASSGYYGEAEELARTRGFDRLRRLILRNTEFAAISADIEAQWLALGVPWTRMNRMSSGVDTDLFRPGPPDPAIEASLPPRSQLRVVFTGRLHPQKNLEILLNAWPTVVARTGATLILVGDGPDRDRLEVVAERLSITGYVHFTGPVADPSGWLRSADAFVLPSVAEGMSNSLLEAMSTGLPCLASRIGGNTDLLGGTEPAGVLVGSNRAEAWSAALIDLLTRPDQLQELGMTARRRVEAAYSIRAVVDRYQSLYESLIARHRRIVPLARSRRNPKT